MVGKSCEMRRPRALAGRLSTSQSYIHGSLPNSR